jgi:membrane protease YdiL (CAAX protease family)
MSLSKFIRDGFTSATRIPAPLVIMFLVTLLLALGLTLPVAVTMNAWVGQRAIARELARSFDGWLLVEPWLRTATGQVGVTPSDQAAAYVLLSMMGTMLVAWLVSSLPNILLGGGVLLTYMDGHFEWRRFLWGAWHWMLPFWVLALLWTLVSALVVALGVGLLILPGVASTTVLMVLLLGSVALVYAVLMAIFDYARVIAVADGTRNIFSAFGRAVGLIVRQPLPALGLYLFMSALGLALIPLYASVVAPIIPFEWGVAAVAAQQLFIIARLWTRLARWASQLALYRQTQRELTEPLQASQAAVREPRSDSTPWGWPTALGLLMAHLVVQVGLGIVAGSSLLAFLLLTVQNQADWAAWVNNGVFLGATGIASGLISLALIYALVTRLRKRPFRATIGWVGRTRVWVAAFGAVLLGGAMDALTLALHQPLVPSLTRPWYVGVANAATMFVLIVIITPPVEEMLFRGVLYPVVARSLGTVAGVVVVSVLFALMHVATYGLEWYILVQALVAGLYLTWLRAWTGKLSASVAAHAALNLYAAIEAIVVVNLIK